MNDQQKALQALIEKPTTYSVDIEDNSMLPANLKDKEVIDFVVKPPTLGVLAMCASLLQDIPEHLLKEGSEITVQDILPYTDVMVKVISRISWNKQADYPDWYEKFLLANASGKDIFMMFQEVAIKSQSDFFLRSFQIANLTNPMMMRKMPKKKSDSTPLNS